MSEHKQHAVSEEQSQVVVSNGRQKKRHIPKLNRRFKVLIIAVIVIAAVAGVALYVHDRPKVLANKTNDPFITAAQGGINASNASNAQKSQSYITAATAYINDKDLPDAIASLKTAEKLTPNDAAIPPYLGGIYFEQKDKSDTIAQYQLAITLANKPGNESFKPNIVQYQQVIEQVNKGDFSIPKAATTDETP
jgi:tetratricopeptide (TPR) repeat protein